MLFGLGLIFCLFKSKEKKEGIKKRDLFSML
ncbi:hypothetical protein SGRA_0293 [Saprospira grandis str. Lewin]|uniref:Uncharacterized protein n=1 Tax=Saprospira grandis (strain Lewin) TaxID=984262 RepID=H6L7K0_SAPGL|nr:hypothetical protein SGRA_0293 [Saprospira grandis str. Lewin]